MCVRPQTCEIDLVDSRFTNNRVGRCCRYQPKIGFNFGERMFYVQPALNTRALGEHLRDHRISECLLNAAERRTGAAHGGGAVDSLKTWRRTVSTVTSASPPDLSIRFSG